MAAMLAGCGVATASPSVKPLLPSEPTLIDYVDPSTVQGMSTRSLNTQGSKDRRVHAAYPAVSHAPPLTEKLRETVAESLDRFTREVSRGALPEPEFNVDWQLAAASPEVLGVRLRIGRSTGSGWRESRTTLWYDRAIGRALGSPGLLRDGTAPAALAGLVGKELALRGSPVNPDALKPTPATFDSIGFNPRGDLVVEFDDEQVSPGVTGRVAVAVPSATAAPLLSATGLRAREAAVGGGRGRRDPHLAGGHARGRRGQARGAQFQGGRGGLRAGQVRGADLRGRAGSRDRAAARRPRRPRGAGGLLRPRLQRLRASRAARPDHAGGDRPHARCSRRDRGRGPRDPA